MQSKATTIQQYLAELPADRRAALEQVRQVILKNLDPLFEEGMQYGMIGYYVPHRVYPPGYHCDPSQPLPFTCLASQKNHMAVYLGCIYGQPENERWFREAWAKAGKKLDMGKACLRFRKLDDLALDVLGQAIRRTRARKFIEFYESVIKARGLGRSKGKSQAKKKATGRKKASKAAASTRRK